jgi:hypothetical protein
MPEPQAEPQPLSIAEMRTNLLETIELTEADFRELARSRATIVNSRLLELAEIEPERISIAAEPVLPEDAAPSSDKARVFFGLQ